MRSLAFVIVTAVAIPASAHTHFNSQVKLPTDPSETTRNLVLADMTGDGLKELVGYTQDTGGFEISVATSSYPTTLLARFDTHGNSAWKDGYGSPVAIDAVFVGRFTSTAKENSCFRSHAIRRLSQLRRDDVLGWFSDYQWPLLSTMQMTYYGLR